jgi:hypothetical protein
MARLTFIVKILLLTALLLNGCSKAPESPSVTPTKAPLEEENSGVSQDTENNGPADTINLPSNREPSTAETTLANRPEQTAPSEQASSSATPTQSIDAAPPISVLDISESNREGKNGILVTFSAQVNSAEDLQSYFAVHTENGDSVDGSWIVDDSLRKVWFMNTEPASRYKVTVNPGIPALNGSELFFSFSIPSPPADCNRALTLIPTVPYCRSITVPVFLWLPLILTKLMSIFFVSAPNTSAILPTTQNATVARVGMHNGCLSLAPWPIAHDSSSTPPKTPA